MQDITVPPEFDQELSHSMNRFLMAKRCDKKLDMSQIRTDAWVALRNFYKRAGKTNPDAVANYFSATMKRVETEPDPVKDKVYTPEMCAGLATSLRDEIGK